ncbi:MAG: hypothetical protein DMF53_17250 [Acidobacteria bacterium]|nr:MAG: hypothetical protein DMF53_17250 [Acidobacteriota bacterium]
MRLQGTVTVEEAKSINEAHLEYAQDVSHFFYMINLEDLGDLPAAARREASSVLKVLPVRGTVVCNAPLRAKVLAKLLLTAASLFRKGEEGNPILFADSEEEARALIDKRRQHVREAAA